MRIQRIKDEAYLMQQLINLLDSHQGRKERLTVTEMERISKKVKEVRQSLEVFSSDLYHAIKQA